MSSFIAGRRAVVGAAILILVVGAIAYSNTFSVPFLFDDFGAIPGNPRIRHLFPIWEALLPQVGSGLVRRPVAQFSFAIDHAIGGLGVAGFHLTNLAIHLLAGLALFGIVRRTLESSGLREKWGSVATPLAAAIALVWVAHPLQTASVTEVVRRIESLMGLFFLSTLYSSIRAMQSGRRVWFVAAVVACALGMATKERMVVAPLMVLLYDRAFVAGSFAEALRRRSRFHLALASTWAILVALLVFSPKDAVTGLATGTSPWDYARAQTWAIPHYLQLFVWPHPLVLDYGELPLPPFPQTACLAIVVLLLAAAAVSFVRQRHFGFLGAWFFLLLAPSSSFIPVRTPIEEHHMYLPLAATAAFAVIGLHVVGSRILGRSVGIALGVVVIGASTWTTLLRNHDYRSERAIYEDTLEKRPLNARAHYNLGNALFDEKRLDEAVARYEEAIRIDPGYVHAHVNLGRTWMRMERWSDAIASFSEAVRLDPSCSEAYSNLGVVYVQKGRLDEAAPEFEKALAADPDNVAACRNYGALLLRTGHADEAIVRYEQAIRILPESGPARSELAAAYAAGGRLADAVKTAREALDLAVRAGARSDAQKIRAQLDSYESGRSGRDRSRQGR